MSLEGVAPRDVRPAWATNCRVHTAADSAAGGGGSDAAQAAGCGCGAGEPTEEEYGAAVSEATQALQAAVTSINDVLDELREAMSGET